MRMTGRARRSRRASSGGGRVRHIGVDGCGGGWIAVSKSAGELRYAIFATARELFRAYSTAERICIDVPIGLPWRRVPIRPCDRMARTILGARRSSVFPVPCRAALLADTFERAKRSNRKELGRALSRQAWGISPRIREVDRLLTGRLASRVEVREAHPEVCFWALAGRSPMKYSKKEKNGFRERLSLLTRFEPGAEEFVSRVLHQEPRRRVVADDVLDALVTFVTASTPRSRLGAICGTPATDERGLPMEMVYVASRAR